MYYYPALFWKTGADLTKASIFSVPALSGRKSLPVRSSYSRTCDTESLGEQLSFIMPCKGQVRGGKESGHGQLEDTRVHLPLHGYQHRHMASVFQTCSV